MTAYCVFDPTGNLQEVHRTKGSAPVAAAFPPQQLRAYPKGTRIGIYQSQEMLPESKLEIAVGNAKLEDDGKTFRINWLEEIEERLRDQYIDRSEREVIGITREILAVDASIAELAPYISPWMADYVGRLRQSRARFIGVVKRLDPAPISVDENLARIVGESFLVTLDPVTVGE